MSARVVVIGAGLVGSCCAWRLAQTGAQVTVLERDFPASGATGTSFAWVGSSYEDAINESEYFQLKLHGIRARERLAQELGPRCGLHRVGALLWDDQPDSHSELARGLELLRQADVPCELLSAQQAMELEPEVRIPADVSGVAFLPDDGYVSGQTMVAAVLQAAQAAGATLRTATEVVEVMVKGGRAEGVRTAAGEELAADVVLVAAGADTGRIVASVGGDVPLVPPDRRGSDAIGLIVTTEPCNSLLVRLVVNKAIMFRPDGGGRLLVHSYDVDRSALPDSSPEERLKLGEAALRQAARLLPPQVRMTVASARVGVRPLPIDGLTVAGPISECPGLYAVVTHSGITLGPLLGELVATEILSDQPAALLQSFRPERFAERHARNA